MAVITIPTVTNWSVKPQNGVEGYFTKMNTWIYESTDVINSLQTAIVKMNENSVEINSINENVNAKAQQVSQNASSALESKNSASQNANIASTKANEASQSATKAEDEANKAKVYADSINTEEIINYINNKPSGFKNLIINPNRTINQRNIIGTALDVYYEDRWAGNGSGGLYQKIENLNIQISGIYTISWIGAAACTISESTDNITYTILASNVNSGDNVNLTKNTYVKVEFNTTDFAYVQLEEGESKTSFEQRPIGLELSLCQRYYELIGGNHGEYSIAGNQVFTVPQFTQEKRVIPTITVRSLEGNNVYGGAVILAPTLRNCGIYNILIVNTGICNYIYQLSADAEL